MGRVVIVGALLLAAAFGLFEYFEREGHGLDYARTVAVNVFVFGEMLYLFNCRSLTRPSWSRGFFSNRLLFAGVAVMIGLQMLFTYLPGMNKLFGTTGLDGIAWAWILGSAVGIHVIVEIEKWIRRVWTRTHTPSGGTC